jgi:hypothetical protein
VPASTKYRSKQSKSGSQSGTSEVGSIGMREHGNPNDSRQFSTANGLATNDLSTIYRTITLLKVPHDRPRSTA